jgi:hypothetical protein
MKENVLNADYEIIVVNNDEAPLFAAFEKEGIAEDLKIQIINNPKNVGFGAANNIGTKAAKGEILCFLNPDTEIITENILEITNKFNENKNIGIIGPRMVEEDGRTQEWIAGKEVTVLSIFLNNLGYKRDKQIWESKSPIECAWVSGAAMFIRKEIFEKIGGFDENFFMYFEDIDLCKRARLVGYKVIYFPEFVINHFGGKSFELDKKKQKKYYRKSQWRYFRKYFL